ncbi:hypothetical protein GRS48_12780 [Halorubrum sp. JWXQ-INN 858]|uniref:DUF6663 family protein n=1 Tax=Halorubrum sp. JWXQ-INN 858 TaxID=2690782 RepID=UPI0013590796|nr:DUF6663 family protein [Halorubrum sp. JWXQ-INN 858]MWV65687.1 hypothetical protein [Halorubrum sp. JWXQ-INN 858]
MQPTTSGRFRVHDRRPRPDVDGNDDPNEDAPEEFALVGIPDGPVDPSDPDAADVYDPLYAIAEGYDDDLAARVEQLTPGTVVDATVAWDDGTARFTAVSVVRESRFRFADGVEGIYEAAVEAWQGVRADGEAFGSVTTRANDGEPNGALYLFADGPGSDTYGELRAGRLPIEPLVERVNDRRGDDRPREVFVLRPVDHDFVAVHVVFDRDGVLARTIRDTYDLGTGLAAGLDPDGGRRDRTADGDERGDTAGRKNTSSDDADEEDTDGASEDDTDGTSEDDAGGFDVHDRL